MLSDAERARRPAPVCPRDAGQTRRIRARDYLSGARRCYH